MNARFWLRWSWRDLRERWLLVAAIGLTVALGTGAYAGLTSTSTWARMSYDESFAALRMYDLRVRLAAGSFLDAGTLAAALRDAAPGAIDQVEERLIVPTQVDASGAGRTILIPGQLVGLPVADGGPSVNRLFVEQGRGFASADAGRLVGILEYHFARHYALPPAGTIRLGGDQALDYVGQALTPESFMVITERGGLLAEANFAIVFVPLETARTLSGRAGAVNDAVLTLAGGADPVSVRSTIERALAARFPGVGSTVMTPNDDDAHRTLYRDLDNNRAFFNVFAALLLAGAAFGAFNLTSRIVEAQRRQIGIAMALGAPTWMIALRPLLVSAQIALLGVVFGVGVGLAVGEAMRGVFTDVVPLPIWRTPFQFGTFAAAALLGFAVPFVAALYPIGRAVRVPPIDAIRTGHLAGRARSAPLRLRRLLVGGRTLARMPLRNVLRTPRRTLVTALGIGAAIAVMVGTGGTVDTMNATIDRGEAEVLAMSPDRLTVDLEGFYPPDAVLARLRASPVVAAAEPGLRIAGSLAADGADLEVLVELLDLRDGLWRPTLLREDAAVGDGGIILSEKAARDLGVAPGAEVTLKHPSRTGPTSFAMVDTPVRVRGIQPAPLRFTAYLDIRTADRLGLGDLANLVLVEPVRGASADDVKRALFGSSGVASVQPVTALVEVYRRLVEEHLGVLTVAELAALLLALAIAVNSATISLDERSREHATMFAFGVRTRSVLRIVVVEHVILGILGTAVGLIGGRLLLQWLMESLMPSTFPDIGFTLAVSTGTLLAAAGSGVIAVGLAPLLGFRRLSRMDVPSTLRVVE